MHTSGISSRDDLGIPLHGNAVLAPQLSEHKSFITPGAHTIFLHRNVLYNNIKFVTEVMKNTGGSETE